MSIPKPTELIKWLIPKAAISAEDLEQLTLDAFNVPKTLSMDVKFKTLNDLVNKEKNKQDQYESQSKTIWLRGQTDYYKGLKDKTYLGSKIERYSNAWLKMFEMLNHFGYVFKSLIPADKPYKINTLHVAELPGSMISATHHWMWQNYVDKYPDITHDWYAESWVTSDKLTLSDEYGLIAKFPDRWWIGVDDGLQGDISDPRQILYIEEKSKHLETLPVLLSGDLGMDSSDDYDREEQLNMLPQFGQDVCCLLCLQKGGLFITKHHSTTLDFTVSWIALLSCFFDEFYLCKLTTSRARNSEIYFVGVGFHGISEHMRESLLAKVTDLKSRNWKDDGYTNSLLTEDQIGNTTYTAIFKATKSRSQNQILYLSFVTGYIADGLRGNDTLNRPLSRIKRDAVDLWINANPVKPIPDTQRITKF